MDPVKKLLIRDIVEGEFVKEVNVLKTKFGAATKARVLATVVDKFLSSKGNYGALTLDDATETIRAKVFNQDLAKISTIEIGDIIDVLCSIREYEGEVYLVPVSMQKVDPNWEVLRKIEIMKERSEKKKDEPLDIDPMVLKKVKELETGSGVSITELVSNLKEYDDTRVIEAVRSLLAKGDLFEPKKGIVKEV